MDKIVWIATMDNDRSHDRFFLEKQSAISYAVSMIGRNGTKLYDVSGSDVITVKGLQEKDRVMVVKKIGIELSPLVTETW